MGEPVRPWLERHRKGHAKQNPVAGVWEALAGLHENAAVLFAVHDLGGLEDREVEAAASARRFADEQRQRAAGELPP